MMSTPPDSANEVDDEVELIEREKGQWLGYWLASFLYLVTPFFLGTYLPQTVATTSVLITLGVGSLALGVIDGIVFRPSVGYAFACAAMQLIAGWMYYNKGAWLYAVAAFLVVGLGGLISKALHHDPAESANGPDAESEA